MDRSVIFISFFAALSLFSGCGDKSKSREPGWIVGGSEKKIKDMAESDVIVSVNGNKLTKARYDQMLKNNKHAFQMMKPNAEKGELVQFLRVRESALIREFISRQFYLEEAKRRGIEASPEKIVRIQKIYSAQAEREGKTLSELAKSMGDSKSEFKKRINERALIETLMTDQFGDTLEVTDEDMKKYRQRYKRYNMRCDATNKLVMARGAEIVKQLKDGADFTELAGKYSEAEEDENGYWGEFTRPEIEDANVRHAAFTLPVGAVSAPFDTETGLVIIKVLERTGVDAVVAEEVATVKLGRILLRLGQQFVCPPEKELRKEIAREKKKHFMGKFTRELKKVSRVEFPNGTNLWQITKNRGVLGALRDSAQ